METPFDTFIDDLWQAIFNPYQRQSTPSVLSVRVFSFAKVARALYMNMAQSSELIQQHIVSQRTQPSSRTMTMQEMRERDDYTIRSRLSYIQFIEQLNRTGRVLKNSGYPPPLYSRIYFFRNNMIEHSDRYLQFLSDGDGLSWTGKKIAIPYDLGGIHHTESIRSSLQQELTKEFAKSGVVLPSLLDKWFGEYSEIIYTALEKIDSKLRYKKREEASGIPEPLIILLFKYNFPTPICDVEAYCTTLVEWLKTLPLQ